MPPDALSPVAPYPNQYPTSGQAKFQTAHSANMNPPQAPQVGHPLDSDAVLSTTSAPVPSAAASESQLSTFHSSATGGPHIPGSYGSGGYGTGAYPMGMSSHSSGGLPHGMHPSMHAQHAHSQALSPQQSTSLNPFAAVATGGAPGPMHAGAYNSTSMGASAVISGGLTGGPTGGPQYSGGMSGGPQFSGGTTGGPYAAMLTGGSAGVPGVAAGVTTANPFAVAATADLRAPLDTTSTAALMTPLTYSPDRDRMLYLGKGVLFEDSLLQVCRLIDTCTCAL